MDVSLPERNMNTLNKSKLLYTLKLDMDYYKTKDKLFKELSFLFPHTDGTRVASGQCKKPYVFQPIKVLKASGNPKCEIELFSLDSLEPGLTLEIQNQLQYREASTREIQHYNNNNNDDNGNIRKKRKIQHHDRKSIVDDDDDDDDDDGKTISTSKNNNTISELSNSNSNSNVLCIDDIHYIGIPWTLYSIEALKMQWRVMRLVQYKYTPRGYNPELSHIIQSEMKKRNTKKEKKISRKKRRSELLIARNFSSWIPFDNTPIRNDNNIEQYLKRAGASCDTCLYYINHMLVAILNFRMGFEIVRLYPEPKTLYRETECNVHTDQIYLFHNFICINAVYENNAALYYKTLYFYCENFELLFEDCNKGIECLCHPTLLVLDENTKLSFYNTETVECEYEQNDGDDGNLIFCHWTRLDCVLEMRSKFTSGSHLNVLYATMKLDPARNIETPPHDILQHNKSREEFERYACNIQVDVSRGEVYFKRYYNNNSNASRGKKPPLEV